MQLERKRIHLIQGVIVQLEQIILQEKVIQAVQILDLVTSLHRQQVVLADNHLQDLIIQHLRVEVQLQEVLDQEAHQVLELAHQVEEEDNT